MVLLIQAGDALNCRFMRIMWPYHALYGQNETTWLFGKNMNKLVNIFHLTLISNFSIVLFT